MLPRFSMRSPGSSHRHCGRFAALRRGKRGTIAPLGPSAGLLLAAMSSVAGSGQCAAHVIFSKSAISGMNLNITTHGRQRTQNKSVILAIMYDAVAAARFLSGWLCTVAQQRPCAASFLQCFCMFERKIEKTRIEGCKIEKTIKMKGNRTVQYF